ncbi:MAG: putative cell survival pathways protein [Chaenotheca gracillima]|nr:MAG: putative cell survival pathways protein [Chaenotheca gracillima]
MLNWAKKQLADVAGTQEPIYGPTAIDSVANQTKDTPWTETTKEDLKWTAMESTCVETQTFYLVADSGRLGMAQVIYSNVAGIRTTCQFNCKIFSKDGKAPHLWSSNPVSNYGFDQDKLSFYADSCAVTLSEDGNQYTIKSATNENSIVNLTFTKEAPGFHVGKDGSTYFGTDLKEPWGVMKHTFWPRNKVEGVIITKDGDVDFKGKGFFSFALQGMKPHHAAAKWNFLTFQSPSYSAVIMEFTTPPSYGSTVVSVGGIAKDGEIITASSSTSAKHSAIRDDPENEWPEPSEIDFTWDGATKDGKAVTAKLAGQLNPRLDKVDVMAEVPKFVKNIVGNVAGTKPYIYQFAPNNPHLTLKLKIGDEETEEEGVVFTEATFIS